MMFGTRRLLQEISETTSDTRSVLAEISETTSDTRSVLAEISETTSDTRSVLEEISETLRAMNARMDRGFGDTRAAVENNTRVTREIVLELREQRPILERIDHGVHSNTEGLLHVLDELRNRPAGPGTAPAV